MTDEEDVARDFITTLRKYYDEHGRHGLPWRLPEADRSFDPYKILVSEIMLQQTQVARVIPKYEAFLKSFPTVESLTAAELAEVLLAWQGLGYNRRAKYLWEAARAIKQNGYFPTDMPGLVALPGVGVNTAGAILAYAYNQPVVFVETNIRTVYIHHFTRDGQIVSDDFIRDLVSSTIDRDNPREFYWALMDYGSHLKTLVKNNHRSKHYVKQSPFQGSRRQVRGEVLRLLRARPCKLSELKGRMSDDRLPGVLEDLLREGLISQHKSKYYLG